MKIIFICSSLEPGRDGVGDYTRRLASELIRQGHFVTIIALNDKYANSMYNEIQQSGGIDIRVLRLSSLIPIKQRLQEAKKIIDKFNPDWLSLQLVIFGFHPKGLPFSLGSQLCSLAKDRKWHVMLHELWIGTAYESSNKHRYLGIVQKFIIKKLLTKLKPNFIHTQSSLYQAQLHSIGFKAEKLDLFGNVSRVRDENFQKDGVFQNPLDQKLLVIFGTIHPGAPIKQFANDVAIYAKKEKINIQLKIVGRSGPELEKWVSIWRNAGLTVDTLGEQPSEFISQILENSSFGISTSAYVMIEKSGTVAAMREHGLPIICVSNAYTPRDIVQLPLPTGIFEYKPGNFEFCVENSKVSHSTNTVQQIAVQLTTSLSLY